MCPNSMRHLRILADRRRLVLVDDAEMVEAPMHVWQAVADLFLQVRDVCGRLDMWSFLHEVSSAGFSRLQASGCEAGSHELEVTRESGLLSNNLDCRFRASGIFQA